MNRLKHLGSGLWKLAKVCFYIAASTWLVLTQPAIAIAFMAVWVAKKAKNEYERVVLSAVCSIVVAFLIFNFAELAILMTVLPVHDVVGNWAGHVAAA